MNVLENPNSFKQVRGFYYNRFEADSIGAQFAGAIESTPNFQTQSTDNGFIINPSAESVGADATDLIAGSIFIIEIELERGQRNQGF